MSLLESKSKIDYLLNACVPLSTIVLLVPHNLQVLTQHFKDNESKSFDVTDDYVKACFVYARLCKKIIDNYINLNKINWNTTDQVDLDLLKLVVSAADDFFNDLHNDFVDLICASESNAKSEKWIKEAVKDAILKSDHRVLKLSIVDAVEIFAAVLAFALAKTSKTAAVECKTLTTINDALSHTARRSVYYIETKQRASLKARIGEAKRNKAATKVQTIDFNDLNLFKLNDFISITHNAIDDAIDQYVDSIFKK